MRDVGSYSRDSFNLEQVEVIKGPASTFGGRGSTGGAINLSPRRRCSSRSGRARSCVGNADTQRVTVDANEASSTFAGGSAVRLNAMWQDAGVPGRDVVNNRNWAVAPSIAFGLERQTRATFNYQHVSQDNVPDYGLPWGTSTDAATERSSRRARSTRRRRSTRATSTGFGTTTTKTSPTIWPRSVSTATSARVRGSRTARARVRPCATPPSPRHVRLTASCSAARCATRCSRIRQRSPRRSARERCGTNHVRAGVRSGGPFTRNSAQTMNQPQMNLRNPDPNQLPFGPMPANTGDPGEARTSTIGGYLFDTVRARIAPGVERRPALGSLDVDYQLTTLATGAATNLSRVDSIVSWRAGAVFKPRRKQPLCAATRRRSIRRRCGRRRRGAVPIPRPSTTSTSSRNRAATSKSARSGRPTAAAGLTAALFRTEKTNARTRKLTSDPYRAGRRAAGARAWS